MLSIHVQIRHQRNLYYQNGRNAVFEFLVHRLCQTFIPIHAPMLPPTTASNKSVASEIRHLAFLALYLSMPYMVNATALMARR